MTIGIINQKARDKAYFGEILPWSHVAPDKSRGRRIMLSTALWRHYDPPRCVFQEKGSNKDPVKLEDYHAMLSVALKAS
jgi:hypothetical protein